MKIQIQNRQQVLTILVAVAVGLWLANKIILNPLSGFWGDRSKEIAKLRQQVDNGKRLIDREKSLRGRWDDMNKNTLPNDESQAEQLVLKAFDRWSQDSRVTLMSISPQWKHDADEYMTLQCRVDAAGNLENVKNFLFALEKDPLALKLDSVEITSRDAIGQQLTLALQISGLVLTPQEKRP